MPKTNHRACFRGGALLDSPCKFKRWGFTLAEVLITLGIIGVVAAITIPGLVNKYQEKIFVNRLLILIISKVCIVKDIPPKTGILQLSKTISIPKNYPDCEGCQNNGTNHSLTKDSNTAVSFSDQYWSSSEISATSAWNRHVLSSSSLTACSARSYKGKALCVGD